MFSSIAALVGSQGLANYAAANMFLNSFSEYLNTQNIKAVSVNWGPWSGGGMAEALDGRLANIKLMGLKVINPNDGIQILMEILKYKTITPLAIDCDWNKFVKLLAPSYLKFFVEFVTTNNKTEKKSDKKNADDTEKSVEEIELKNLSKEEKIKLIKKFLIQTTAEVMAYKTTDLIDENISLLEQGFDSLMTINFRKKISEIFKIELPIAVLYDYQSINELTNYIFEHQT